MTIKLDKTSLQHIISGCNREAQDLYAQETGYCFELFCRALEKQEELAWDAIQTQYQRLVIKWLREISKGSLLDEEIDLLLQDTFVRFWRTLSKKMASFRQHFQHVGALLKYMKQCAITAFLDYKRQWERRQRLNERLINETEVSIQKIKAGEAILDHMIQSEQLENIYLWIKKEVTDPLEILVLQLCYEQGLSPAAIVIDYPHKFKDAREIYRIRERILRRAKRALAS